LKDVVATIEDSGLFQSQQIPHFFHHAENTCITIGILANLARIIVCEIEAGGAKAYVSLDFQDTCSKGLSVFPWCAEKI
jgi:hypothetical protein